MESCEVLIVGGGPAGSTCAAKLVTAGIDVLLLDKANFPRSKPCAGWITPAVFEALAIDPAVYGQGRVLQAISGFRTGLISGSDIVTRYDQIVSYGILRREFDDYLLQRSHVRRRLGEGVNRLDRQDGGWLVNGRIKARLLVGAGGHFCPLARRLGARLGKEEVVVAQVAEEVLTPEEASRCPVAGDTPVLFFCPDLQGYGWLFRKGNVLNVGLGRHDRQDFHRHLQEFCAFLVARGDLPADFSGRFHGHAYGLYDRHSGRRCVGEGALLIGDAAGLAAVHSGEGILPAVESALLAAAIIVAAQGDYTYSTLTTYAASLIRRRKDVPSFSLPATFVQRLGSFLLSSPWATRHLILNRCFLHSQQSTKTF